MNISFEQKGTDVIKNSLKDKYKSFEDKNTLKKKIGNYETNISNGDTKTSQKYISVSIIDDNINYSILVVIKNNDYYSQIEDLIYKMIESLSQNIS